MEEIKNMSRLIKNEKIRRTIRSIAAKQCNWEQLREEAKRENTTVSAIVDELLDGFLSNTKYKVKHYEHKKTRA